jgi:hypothetical protein
MPFFQMGCMGQKSDKSCSFYSPDGVPEVSAKKNAVFILYWLHIELMVWPD